MKVTPFSTHYWLIYPGSVQIKRDILKAVSSLNREQIHAYQGASGYVDTDCFMPGTVGELQQILRVAGCQPPVTGWQPTAQQAFTRHAR